MDSLCWHSTSTGEGVNINQMTADVGRSTDLDSTVQIYSYLQELPFFPCRSPDVTFLGIINQKSVTTTSCLKTTFKERWKEFLFRTLDHFNFKMNFFG